MTCRRCKAPLRPCWRATLCVDCMTAWITEDLTRERKDAKRMAKEIEETGITIDHDLGRIWIDTRNQAFQNMCRRAGLVPDGDKRRAPYVRFACTLSDVDVIVRRHRMARPPSLEARAAGLAAIKKARGDVGARQK